MIIECAHCHAKYHYEEARFEGKPSKKIRCAKCQQVFEIRNPGAAASPSVPTTAPPAPKPVPKPPPAQPVRPQPTAPPSPKRSEQDRFDSTGTKKAEHREEPVPAEAPRPAAASMAPSADTTPKLPEGRRLSLAIIDGPDSGTVFRIEKPRVVIGRAGADLVLNDSEISRAHAAVEIRETEMVLQDLGSTNGTLVDGSRIQGQVELYNQAEFQIGSTTLMMIVTEEG